MELERLYSDYKQMIAAKRYSYDQDSGVFFKDILFLICLHILQLLPDINRKLKFFSWILK